MSKSGTHGGADYRGCELNLRKAEEIALELGVSKHTIYAWKQKYGGLEVAEAQELKHLREENSKLEKLLASTFWARKRWSR